MSKTREGDRLRAGPLLQHIDEVTPLLSENGLAPAEHVGHDGAVEEVAISEELSDSRLYVILGSVYVGVFLGALDSTVIATLSAPISSSFNSLSLLSWLASAYLIANAACQPISGRLTDIFSRGTGLVISNALFAAGNLMCGLASTEGMMIAGRVVSGLGGGGLTAIATFVASDLVPLRKRGIIQGIGNVCFGAGAGLGGLFGGWINDVWGWRVAFLAQVPFIIVSGILVFIYVDIPAKKSEKSKLSRVDFLGAFALVMTLLLLLLGLNSGGNLVPWSHPLILTTLSLSAMTLLAFIWIEARWAKEPVIPVKLLLNPTVAAACLTNWFAVMGCFIILFYIPIFFQVRGLSTTQAGACLIPQFVGSSIGSLMAGIIMKKTGKYRFLGLGLVLIFALGSGLLSKLDLNSPDWPAFLFLFLEGMGFGGGVTVLLVATISAVEHEYQAVVTSATYAFRSTGATIGITIASAVYQNILKRELWGRFGHERGAAEEIKRIRDDFDEIFHLPPGWHDGVLVCYMDALRGVFLTALGVSILSLVCYCFIREHTLHKTLARN